MARPSLRVRCAICTVPKTKLFTHALCDETACVACCQMFLNLCGDGTDVRDWCMFCREPLDYSEISQFANLKKYKSVKATAAIAQQCYMYKCVYKDLLEEYTRATSNVVALPEYQSRLKTLNTEFHTHASEILARRNVELERLEEQYTQHRNEYDALATGAGFKRYPGPIEKESVHTSTRATRVQICKCGGILSYSTQDALDLELPVCTKCKSTICIQCKEPALSTGHACDSSTLETLRIIEESCKQCPMCHVDIQKTEGCNDMWCTRCHTSFNWRTLEISRRDAHNPHRQTYLAQVRAENVDLCGRDVVTSTDLGVVRNTVPLYDYSVLVALRSYASGVAAVINTQHALAIKSNADRLKDRYRLQFALDSIGKRKFGKLLYLLNAKIEGDVQAFAQYMFLRETLEQILVSYFEDPNRCINAVKQACAAALSWFEENCRQLNLAIQKPRRLLYLEHNLVSVMK